MIEEEQQEVAAIDEAAAAMITKVRWLAAALALAAIIATGAFLSGLMARLQKPLRALVDGMARLSLGDFGQRIADSGRDEFAHLANGLNAMADQLQSHSLQANAARDDLERVVSQRTKELQDANRFCKERTMPDAGCLPTSATSFARLSRSFAAKRKLPFADARNRSRTIRLRCDASSIRRITRPGWSTISSLSPVRTRESRV